MIRRTFLTHALGVGGLALLPGWLRAQSMDHSMHDMAGMDHSMATPLPQGLAATDALPRGAALGPLHRLSNQSSQPGLFKAELSAAPVQVELLPGQPTTFWAYNASIPGPLIEVNEGDRVEVRFINRLRQPSTVHWHGLPVPPARLMTARACLGGRLFVTRFHMELTRAGQRVEPAVQRVRIGS